MVMDEACDMPGGYKDGWNNWNPHNVKHNHDGISDCDGFLEFYWSNGDVVAYRCLICGEEGWNEK